MSAWNTRPDQSQASLDEPSAKRAAPAPITVRVPEAARLLGISRSRIYELITSGDIETVKLGRATLVPVSGLHALIDRLRREQWG
ncbi:helix-turn-helix domain-containing protein [Sphingomonas lycopersici]|uniref:helix-turn-helix domain-containing protein n=1 Tax=Sphingomonas lycopersici TaxID=2951807 RepID=UPI003D793EA7